MSAPLCGRSITEGKDLIGRFGPFGTARQNGELAKYDWRRQRNPCCSLCIIQVVGRP
jgi:hypothetical protein